MNNLSEGKAFFCFSYLRPVKKPPMNRRQSYHAMNPRSVISPAPANASGSQAVVPTRTAWSRGMPSHRALSPAADRQNRSFKALSGKGSAPATPPPFRHTPFRPRPRHTATVWRNPGQHPHRDGTYTFSAKERDPETDLSYFGSRYYSSDLSIWLSVDPMSDKYASLSPYVYCADNPVKLVDPDGEDYGIPPWLLIKGVARAMEATSANANLKTAAYTINHPINALRVGVSKYGGKSISSVASNFAINMSKAVELNATGEGGKRNAIRHTLWQAILTNKFGPEQAKRIGNIHENGPTDLSQRSFLYEKEADKVVDQLNNEIGRTIGERFNGADNVTLAKQVAKELYNNGLWVLSENSDKTFSIQKTKITHADYLKMINKINKMNNYGLFE